MKSGYFPGIYQIMLGASKTHPVVHMNMEMPDFASGVEQKNRFAMLHDDNGWNVYRGKRLRKRLRKILYK